MCIFSSPKKELNPTPELGEILRNIQEIKTEIAKLSTQATPQPNLENLLQTLQRLEEKVRLHRNRLHQLDKALQAAAQTRLTPKQQTILEWLTTKYREKEVYTNLIKQLSKELGIPESTVRWNLNRLREAQLIHAGTKDHKGVPVTLTQTGRILANYTISKIPFNPEITRTMVAGLTVVEYEPGSPLEGD